MGTRSIATTLVNRQEGCPAHHSRITPHVAIYFRFGPTPTSIATNSIDQQKRFYSVEVSQALVARLTRVRFTVGPLCFCVFVPGIKMNCVSRQTPHTFCVVTKSQKRACFSSTEYEKKMLAGV